MKLLILTKNILAETSFQSKLQQMNNELFDGSKDELSAVLL